MNNKLPILVDMDGVFADFMTSYYEIAKRKHPELYKILPNINEQKLFYIDEEIEEQYPHLKSIAESIIDDDEVFKNILPYKNMVKGMNDLKTLAKEYNREVFICTAPHRSNKLSYSQKPEWIEKYLGYEWLNNLLIVRDKTACKGVILIDDKPDPLGILKPEWEHIVFDRSYNKNILNKNRIFDLDEVTIKKLLEYCEILD